MTEPETLTAEERAVIESPEPRFGQRRASAKLLRLYDAALTETKREQLVLKEWAEACIRAREERDAALARVTESESAWKLADQYGQAQKSQVEALRSKLTAAEQRRGELANSLGDEIVKGNRLATELDAALARAEAADLAVSEQKAMNRTLGEELSEAHNEREHWNMSHRGLERKLVAAESRLAEAKALPGVWRLDTRLGRLDCIRQLELALCPSTPAPAARSEPAADSEPDLARDLDWTQDSLEAARKNGRVLAQALRESRARIADLERERDTAVSKLRTARNEASEEQERNDAKYITHLQDSLRASEDRLSTRVVLLERELVAAREEADQRVAGTTAKWQQVCEANTKALRAAIDAAVVELETMRNHNELWDALESARAERDTATAEAEEWKRVAAEHCDSLDIINEACELAESQRTASRALVKRIEAELGQLKRDITHETLPLVSERINNALALIRASKAGGA